MLFGDKQDQAKQFTVTLVANIQESAVNGDGGKPMSAREALARINQAFDRRTDAEVPLDLTVDQHFVLATKEMPLRIMTGYPKVLEFEILGSKSLKLKPLKVGRTPVAIWFGDCYDEDEQFILTLKVRVRAGKP